MKMKDSERYLQAAEAIRRGSEWYTCIAVADTYGRTRYDDTDDLPAVINYVRMFARNDLELQDNIEDPSVPSQKKLRILLLCMAAAVAADKEKTS